MGGVRLSFLLLALLFTGCADVHLVPFTQAGAKHYSPKAPRLVEVYRSVIPFTPFEQMGVITVALPTRDLKAIYEELRRGAAAAGADAVVGVKIDMRSHDEAVMKEVCTQQETCIPETNCTSADGSCTTENVCTPTPVCTNVLEPKNTVTYLGIGTMLRRVE
jgi:hypothetical protein